MPTVVWILMWAVVLAVVAYFVVRELRSGRKGPGEVERYQHEATRQAGMNREGRGPNGGNSLWVG